MNREELIKAIYEKVAVWIEVCDICWRTTPNPYWECGCSYWDTFHKIYKKVYLWDVLDYWYEISIKNITEEQLLNFEELNKIDKDSFSIVKNILKKYKKLRKPIEEQSDETISFIFDLINSN